MSERTNAPETLAKQKNVFVLCFDGTGNKFSGTEADSNILKLYRMLDRSNNNVYTFYQPGIGTYVSTHSMQTTSAAGRVRSWYLKAKDSAIGTNFAEHVMGGYKFLMRYYSSEDDLYFFGFSRGAYTARFLAEMLDQIGLLSAGNEELIRFAWKTYAKWASRSNDGSDQAKQAEHELYRFMRGFRETFCRPVRRIRFLGLFDTVNSVPKFESAWMQRTKFPYTARSSAKVIRQAVSIDERRAKFRQDLVSGDQVQREDKTGSHIHRYNSDLANVDLHSELLDWRRKPKAVDRGQPQVDEPTRERSENDSLAGPNDPDPSHLDESLQPKHSSVTPRRLRRRHVSESSNRQDIEEVWFPGGHSDIGGGWSRSDKEIWMLSHAPLVWMIHEAMKAGLEFDSVKLARANCHPDRVDDYGDRQVDEHSSKRFHSAFEESYSTGLVHDSLEKGNGVATSTVRFWKMLEYLPFRRMDLQPDGSWKAIRWPLPMGETRDIPKNAQIHHSVIKRMQYDPDYRPGNLIVGGGGRGCRKAPEKYGMGDWKKHKNHDDPIAETFLRADYELSQLKIGN